MVPRHLTIRLGEPDERLIDQLADLLHRHAVGIVLATGLIFNAYEAAHPPPVFSTVRDRQAFFVSIESPPSRVIALVTSWCAACQHLVAELEHENIPFTKVDIESFPVARSLFDRCAATTGSNSIPKVIVDDRIVNREIPQIRIALDQSAK